MVLVLGICAAIWGIGRLLRLPQQVTWLMIGLVYLAVISLHLVLPADNSLRLATGGSAALWLMLGAAAAIVLAYIKGLAWLRARVRAPLEEPAQQGPFNDTELSRYARHIVLREVGGLGQKRLKDAKVLVIGAGGLGSPALLYLAAAGVGTIGVVDDDVVDNSNLQRQVIHPDRNIGMPKVHSAAEAMRAQNPFVTVRRYQRRLSEADASDLIADYDLVLDGTDNFTTRYLVNQVCVAQGKPLISGALSQWEGQISVFDPANDAPCYQCIFPEAPAAGLSPSCAEAGVIGPLPGVVGAMMAAEAIKVITGAGVALRGQMMIYDALYGESRSIALKRRAGCPVCGDGAPS
ncbi:HesA/MoeB/ThiF family protein [Cognatishimia maritima]|uniref:Molybdopterin-synthase adenylyltransferase n=1 Tax=Cognatishimia maritima TaxID=870908 RepID=A0A1M5S0J1_9RHOB|nr:molybdopterin-synthase adenylyltransferase MoeB [Cognatishimia maritima]SHH32142.1 Molybdopterin or thiamine biosynthesis adenylyltransferase [Cognatishimia maritima]